MATANILLVDDDAANLTALEAALAPLGQNLVKAHSGEEALRRLLREDFAVILLDVKMPGLDGFEAAQLIRGRERSQDTPIIFLTAHEVPGFTPAEAYTLGAVDYLLKPVVPIVLRAKVEGFVKLFQRTEQVRQLERHAAEGEALRASERRLRTLLENAWDGISLVGPDGTIMENLPDNLHRLGYEVKEFVGHKGLEFVHPEDAPAVQGALARLLAAPGAKESLQYRLRHKDGSWRWVEGMATNLLHEPGIHALVVNYRDITEQKRAEEELRAASRAKDEFLAMLAHELRNPLAPLLSGLHILRQPGTTPETRERTRDIMQRQTEHLARLVDDLLDVSRITRGKIQLRMERIDLAGAFRTTAEDRRPMLEQEGLRLVLETPETPVWVQGDVTRLAQILNNLVDNAAKFSSRGKDITIRVAADPGQGRAVLSVRDQGIGIEPEMVPRLFEVFIQADRSLARTRGGLGLGLALVKGLVELHEGTVEASSAGLGHGAEFTVRLPLAGEPEALLVAPETPAPAGRQQRILVVEDSRDAADSLRLLLEMLGHEVRVAHTGPQGVQAAREWRPDVVLCDIGLPGLDGYGVARELRLNQTTAHVRLLALTGYGQEEDRRRSRAAGFDYHLVKPADPAELLRLLASG